MAGRPGSAIFQVGTSSTNALVGEQIGSRRAPVSARVAEHDDGCARVKLVLNLLEQLAPDSAIVGVARDVGDASVARNRFADGFEVALTLKYFGHFTDALNEDERAHLAERVVQRMHHREEED